MQTVYSEKIFEKLFSDEVSKTAYLNACKWLAKNVYGSDYANFISVKILKQEPKKAKRTVTKTVKGKEIAKTEEYMLYSFVVELYFNINFESEQQIFCNSCHLAMNTFMGSKPDCKCCKVTGFLRKLKHDTETTVKNLQEEFQEVENNG